MWLSDSDATAVGRCLAQIAEERGDIIDLFLEARREIEFRGEADGPGVAERSDQGFAVRLVRDGQTYLSARDAFEPGALSSALRDVMRVVPANAYRVPELTPAEPMPRRDADLRDFPERVRRALRDLHAAFDFELRVANCSRRIQIVGRRLVPAVETEDFFSVTCSTPWGRFGTLAASLDDGCVRFVARSLFDRFRARDAAPVKGFAGPIVLAPAAAAVLLHEAVAHALEADTLVLSGRPDAALGVSLGSDLLDVLDGPGELPAGLRRQTDDEGIPVLRRWLLQKGAVGQVLADRFHAGASAHLMPGAGRRASRHLAPVPRSCHLELLPGTQRFDELLAAGEGLYFPEISRGRLNPLTGELSVEFPHGQRFRTGGLAERVGRCVLRGKAASVLGAVEALGGDSVFAGAGWCAKGGHRLPVWGTCPHMRLEGLEVGA